MNEMLLVDRQIEQIRQGLRGLTPGPKDSTFADVWGLYTDVLHECGVRLLEPVFGELDDAAEEVRIYLEHFEKVERIAKVLPVKVPKVIHVQLRTLRRYLEDTPERDEVVAVLEASPTITTEFAEYVQRAGGRTGFVIYELLLLLGSSGNLFQGFLARTLPNGGE